MVADPDIAPPAPISASDRNRFIAAKLREAATVLEQQQANPFRVRAYRRAADMIDALKRDLAEVLEREGQEGLDALPGVGPRLAMAISEMIRTGRWSQLERLRGELDPVALLRTVPGIGAELAKRIHDTLDLDTLEALEVAAHDGRLAGVPGIGERRAAMVRSALAQMLGRRRPFAPRDHGPDPPVADVLDVDREYREGAAAENLPKIAPRRFNPRSEAWLPVLHTERGPWRFTALFSNTPRAHDLGKVRDWVVIFFHTDHGPERQCTVVTETRGPLTGRRTVRGREGECATHYAAGQAG